MRVRHLLRWSGSRTHRTGRSPPEQHLCPFRGILQADAFTGYDRLFSAELEGGALTEVACRAHAQKKSTMYISAAKVRRQKKPWSESVNCTPSRMKYGDYQSQSVLQSGSSEEKRYWRRCMNGWWRRIARCRKIQTTEANNNTAEITLRAVYLRKKNMHFGSAHGGEYGSRPAVEHYRSGSVSAPYPQCTAWMVDELMPFKIVFTNK